MTTRTSCTEDSELADMAAEKRKARQINDVAAGSGGRLDPQDALRAIIEEANDNIGGGEEDRYHDGQWSRIIALAEAALSRR